LNCKIQAWSSGIGVYVKWDDKTVDVGSEWRLHVADIENCRYYISTEGERYMTDDNANPPICYNHGKCVPANTGDSNRPAKALTQTGDFTLTHSAGTLAGVGSKFLTELQLGDIVRDANAVDARVTAITADTTATVVSIDTSATLTPALTSRCSSVRAGDSTIRARGSTTTLLPSSRTTTPGRTCATLCKPFTKLGRTSIAKSIRGAAVSVSPPSSILNSTRTTI
jgi:hypothetical protein